MNVYYASLITNRTQADVKRVQELARKGVGKLTDAELEEWNTDMKGAYNVSDLNRVGTALIVVRDRLRTHGIDVPAEVRTDYAVGEIPTKTLMDAYMESANAVYASVPHHAPKPPDSIGNLDYEGANNIEKVIIAVDDVLEANEVGWIYADTELFSGDMGVTT